MTTAAGTLKELRYKIESAWGTAPGATGAQLLRRVTSDLDLKKQTYQSAEIRSDRQRSDFRHGVQSVEGSISGELSPGTYVEFFKAVCGQAFQAAATTGAIITVTAAASAPQFVRSSGSFLTDGFKVGDVVRWTGFAGGSAPDNNSKNFLITALTATDMTGVFLNGDAVVADAEGDSVTCTVAGKKTWVPATGHLDDSYAIEHFYSDVAQSELFLGCKLGQLSIEMPASGMATLAMQFMGRSRTNDTSEYFTTPTAETDSGLLAAVNGLLYVGGTQVAVLTGLSFTVNRNLTAEPAAGTNLYPGIVQGRYLVEGQFTAFFEDATFRDLFDNESEVSIVAALTESEAAAADFVTVVLPRVKVGGAAKDDGEKQLIQTLPFTALLNTAGGASVNSLRTTISIQDSLAT